MSIAAGTQLEQRTRWQADRCPDPCQTESVIAAEKPDADLEAVQAARVRSVGEHDEPDEAEFDSA